MRVRGMMTGVTIGMLLPTMAFGYTGVFRSAYIDLTGADPTGIAVGDFDGDGAVDVATTSVGIGENNLNVHFGLFSCAGGTAAGRFCFQPTDCPGGMCKPDGTVSNAGSPIALGSSPSALLQGKFDGDQLDDLIIAKSDNAVVFVKGLGNTDFFAEPGPPITVGQSPAGLASADIDGDGTADLVVANDGDLSPGSISILHGEGNGSFVLLQQPDPSEPGETVDHLPAELGTRAVAIGNIDADPAPDIVALNSRSSTLSLYTGDGEGSFTPRGTIPTGAAPQDLALLDLNGDGDLDLVIATANEDTVVVRPGNGDRTFAAGSAYPVGNTPNRLVLANVGGDARLDIIVSNNRSHDVSVLLATGPGTFAAARTFVADAQPQALAVGDLNQDGLLDPVVAAFGSDAGASVVVLRNRGAGSLHGVEDLRVANGPAGVAVADLDGDGLTDLVATGGSGQVSLFRSLTNGFASPQVFNIGGRTLGVAAPDLNNDAQPDIVAAVALDPLDGRIAVILSEGGGRFAAPVLYATAPGPAAVTSGDFNGDGRLDVALATIGAEGVCQGGPQPGQVCMTNEDCAPGGICAAPGKASVLLQQSNGSFGPARNTDVEDTPTGIAAVDSNCDGRDDLLVANLGSNTVSALRSNGDGSFTIAQTLPLAQVGLSPIAVTVADFNRDGVDDFAVANTVAPGNNPNVHLLRGSCSGPYVPFGAGGQTRVGELANALVARDFTGDQFVDLALVSQTSNEVCLLVGGGDGTLSLIGQGSCDGVSRMPIAVTAADFDADGRYDAASANNDPSANNLSVLSNCARDVGCDPFPPLPPVTPLPGVAALRGDGNADGARSAADLVAIAAEVMDDDGFRVEAISRGTFVASPGADANGDGRVDAQDRLAVAHRLFSGA